MGIDSDPSSQNVFWKKDICIKTQTHRIYLKPYIIRLKAQCDDIFVGGFYFKLLFNFLFLFSHNSKRKVCHRKKWFHLFGILLRFWNLTRLGTRLKEKWILYYNNDLSWGQKLLLKSVTRNWDQNYGYSNCIIDFFRKRPCHQSF